MSIWTLALTTRLAGARSLATHGCVEWCPKLTCTFRTALSNHLYVPRRCSRRHAVLQHAYDGSLWLYDLFSSQGTKLNEQPVETKKFHRLEPGSLIQFGHSLRKYTVAQGTAVGPSKRSDGGFGGGMEQLAQSAMKSGQAFAKPTNHFSDLQAALRSAGGQVNSKSSPGHRVKAAGAAAT